MTAGTTTITRPVRHPAITAASILCFIMGVGWSIGSPASIVYMIRHRSLPWVRVILPVGARPTVVYTIGNRPITVIGWIRGLSGPFEALGMDAMIVLALLFYVINLLYLLAGYWLWKSHRKGGILEISLLAVSAVFWLGFGLPPFPVMGLLLAGLLAAGWKSLKGETSLG